MKGLDKNKSPGLDRISPWVMEECVAEFTEVLKSLLRESVTTRVVAREWKCADIVPIYKKGDRRHVIL